MISTLFRSVKRLIGKMSNGTVSQDYSNNEKDTLHTLKRISSTTLRPLYEGDVSSDNVILLDFLEKKEKKARKNAEHGSVTLLFLNTLASFSIFCTHLVTWNTVIGVVLTVGMILATNSVVKDDEYFDGRMSWSVVGFALVLPLAAIVRFAFNRRERALQAIALLKTHSLQIYFCHASWDWEKNGGRNGNSSFDSLGHADKAVKELVGMSDDLVRYLTLPSSTLGRHRAFTAGRREAAVTIEAAYLLFDMLLATRMARICGLCEDMKKLGFSPSEASRVRQSERYLGEVIEELRMIKAYRTPQALRAFANVFALILPPLYAPLFVELAHSVNSLAIGILFGIIVSVIFTALYDSVNALEDPFVAQLTLDGIDVHEELSVLNWRQLVTARKIFFPDAEELEISDDKLDEYNDTQSTSRTQETDKTADARKELMSRSKRVSSYQLQVFSDTIDLEAQEPVKTSFMNYTQSSSRTQETDKTADTRKELMSRKSQRVSNYQLQVFSDSNDLEAQEPVKTSFMNCGSHM